MNNAEGQEDRRSKLPVKVVIVGDGSVGKTCLAQTFVNNRFPEEYEPTIFENHIKNLVVDGEVKIGFSLRILDFSNKGCFSQLFRSAEIE